MNAMTNSEANAIQEIENDKYAPYARVISYLAQGYTIAETASVCGCPIAFIKTLVEQDDFKAEIAKQQKELVQESNEDEIVSNRYLAVEHKLLKAIEDKVGSAEFRDIARALEIVGNRQEKRLARKAGIIQGNNVNNGAAFLQTNQTINNVMQFVVPNHAAFVKNEQNEIIAVGDRSMAPLPSDQVRTMFSSIAGAKKAPITVISEGKELSNV